MLKTRIKAIFFDLDGTLVASAGEIAAAVNECLHNWGYAQLPPTTIQNWVGQGARSLLSIVLSHVWQKEREELEKLPLLPLFDLKFTEFKEVFFRHCGSDSPPFPKVIDTLSQLKALGIRLAVLTNKDSPLAEKVLEAHQFTKFFDRIITGSSFSTKKPNPIAIFDTLNKWNIPLTKALLVGDSKIDVLTARNAGIPVIAMSFGYNMGQPVADALPDYLCNDFSEILEIIKNI